MQRLRWASIITTGQALHASYADSTDKGGWWKPHDHDFYEVFWVDSGLGMHLSAGSEQLLKSGCLCFIRPADLHGFRPVASSEPFALINIAFSADAWEDLDSRYGLSSHPIFRGTGSEPPAQELGGELAREVARLFHDTLRASRTPLARDAFLLSLAHILWDSHHDLPNLQRAPAWLRRALMSIARDPKALSKGVGRLAELAACSASHLSRTMRATIGTTPSAWILRQRLERAAMLLDSTGFSVSEVAAESGFNNLSHFHRCFRQAYAVTPLHYRKAHAKSII